MKFISGFTWDPADIFWMKFMFQFHFEALHHDVLSNLKATAFYIIFLQCFNIRCIYATLKCRGAYVCCQQLGPCYLWSDLPRGGNESPQIEIQVESSVSGHNNSKPVHLCLSQQLQYAKQTKTTTTVYGNMEAKYSISGHYNVFILPNTTAG